MKDKRILADEDVINGSRNRKNEDEYSIFSYCKQEPAVAIAVLSASIAAFSFWANSAIYIRERSFLHYWGINPIYASSYSSDQIYWVFGNVVYSISLFLAIGLVMGAYQAHIPASQLISSLNYALKQEKKEIAILKKTLRIAKRGNKKYQKGEELHNKIYSITAKIERAENYVHDTRKKVRDIRVMLNRTMLGHFLLAGIILMLGSAIFTVAESDDLQNIVASSIISIAAILIMLLIFALKNRKKMNKKMIRSQPDYYIGVYSNDLSSLEQGYPLNRKITEYFSNTSIIATVVCMIIYFTMMLISCSIQGADTAKNKTQFPIVECGEITYAIIYNTNNRVIMEMCVVSDGNSNSEDDVSDVSIEINTCKQRIEPVDGLVYWIVDVPKGNIYIDSERATHNKMAVNAQ